MPNPARPDGGKEIKANDAHCARMAAEDLNTPVKPSHVSHVRKKYGLLNPNKPPTYKEIDEAICEIITDADIRIQRYDIYRKARFKNGRIKADIYFGEEEAKKTSPIGNEKSNHTSPEFRGSRHK